MTARASLLVAVLLMSACSAQTPPAKPIVVTGDAKTGASVPFTLSGGSYAVEWLATKPAVNDCLIYLYLATKVNGDAVEDVPMSLTPTYSGTKFWSGVPAGTYVLQEDWTGQLNCHGPVVSDHHAAVT